MTDIWVVLCVSSSICFTVKAGNRQCKFWFGTAAACTWCTSYEKSMRAHKIKLGWLVVDLLTFLLLFSLTLTFSMEFLFLFPGTLGRFPDTESERESSNNFKWRRSHRFWDAFVSHARQRKASNTECIVSLTNPSNIKVASHFTVRWCSKPPAILALGSQLLKCLLYQLKWPCSKRSWEAKPPPIQPTWRNIGESWKNQQLC